MNVTRISTETVDFGHVTREDVVVFWMEDGTPRLVTDSDHNVDYPTQLSPKTDFKIVHND